MAKLIAKDEYVFTARFAAAFMTDAARGFIDEFNKGTAETLYIGKSTAGEVGFGVGHWVVDGKNNNIFRLMKVQKVENGNLIDEELGSFVDNSNKTYEVKVEKIDGNSVTGHIYHMVDKSATISVGPVSSMAKAIEEKVDKKVAEGIVTKENAEHRIQFMRESGATDRDIFMFIDMWVKHEKDPEPEPDCKYQDNFLKESQVAGMDGVVLQCLKFCFLGYGVIVDSARGLGKYVLTQTVAWLLGLPIYHAIFNRDMSPEIAEGKTMTDNTASEWLMSEEAEKVSLGALHGEMQDQAKMNLMTARAASVSIVIDKSEFYKAIKDSGLMAVDELNLGDANLVEKIFNPLLDGQRRMYFPGIGELIAERPFCVIATQNSGSDYDGTGSQNKATMSRFKWIRLKYPKTLRNVIEASAKAELKRYGYDVNIRKEFLDACESFYNKIYKASSANTGSATPNGQISDTALNIRGFVSALVVCTVFEGSSLRQYLRSGVIDVCDEEEVARLMEMLHSCVAEKY